jgi:general secretion pathway protein D
MKNKLRTYSFAHKPAGVLLAMTLLLCLLLVPAVNPCRDNIYAAAPQYFTLNFKDVEITEFLNVMSQLLNKNILLDERVRGKLTISSPGVFR